MATTDRSNPEINISKIPVDGIGGLGLVIMAAIVAWGVPALRGIGLIVMAGGLATGLALLISRHPGVRRTALVLMVVLALALVGAVVLHAWS